MQFIRLVILILCLWTPRYSVAQSILYATGFGTSTSQVPAQWTFSGDNMTINNIGPSSGYPGASGGVYFSEGNHKGFLNTNGVYVYCSQPGTSSATLIVSTAGHTDIELMFGMCKSGAGYNAAVNYSLKYSVDGINFLPLSFTEAPAGRWGSVDLLLPAGTSNVPALYLKWEFNRSGNSGFFKVDDVQVIANDLCAPPVVLNQPITPPAICIGNAIAEFNVLVAGSGPFTYQWQEDSINISDGLYYSGTQTDKLEVLFPHAGFSGKHYGCVITNCSGDTVTTDYSAVLTLRTIPGDFNSDGLVNNSDFVELLVHWNMQCSCSSDIDHDGVVGLLDYLLFVAQFNKACQ